MRRVLTGLVLGAALAWPGGASAGIVTAQLTCVGGVSGSPVYCGVPLRIVVRAARGESNRVLVRRSASGKSTIVVDNRSPLEAFGRCRQATPHRGEINHLRVVANLNTRVTFSDPATPIVARGDCRQVDPHTARCPYDGYSVTVHIGDGDDRVRTIAVYAVTIDGGTGDDQILEPAYSSGYDLTAVGGPGDDRLRAGRADGGPGNDVVLGTADGDRLIGGPGRDLVVGEGGNDRLVDGEQDADAAADVYDGGAASGPSPYETALGDVVDYGARRQAVAIDLGADRQPGVEDRILGVESAVGGAGDDRLSGSRSPNALVGGAGDDVVMGHGKGDRLVGGDGTDLLDGGVGRDALDGGAGDDDLRGGAGPDVLSDLAAGVPGRGGAGPDVLSDLAAGVPGRGGAGPDVLSDLAAGVPGRGGAGPDVLRDLAADVGARAGTGDPEPPGGTAAASRFGDNELHGGAGSDVLRAGDGDDLLVGGPGSDLLTGGTGANHLDAGPDDDELYALASSVDEVACGGGRDAVSTDPDDVVDATCERFALFRQRPDYIEPFFNRSFLYPFSAELLPAVSRSAVTLSLSCDATCPMRVTVSTKDGAIGVVDVALQDEDGVPVTVPVDRPVRAGTPLTITYRSLETEPAEPYGGLLQSGGYTLQGGQ